MMKDDDIIVDTDPMNPLCCIYTFKEADKWYLSKKEAEEDYKKYIKDTIEELKKNKSMKQFENEYLNHF